jgi:hypothetical protein
MINKKIVSITIIIAMAAMFFSSSAFVNPSLAKTRDNTKDSTREDSATNSIIGSTSADKARDSTKDDPTASTSSSAERNYKEFQKCLSDAEGTKGFATNQEIKDCYNPIYKPLSSTTSTNTVTPTDFSSPMDFSKKTSDDINDQ